jgi:hypothetical protein
MTFVLGQAFIQRFLGPVSGSDRFRHQSVASGTGRPRYVPAQPAHALTDPDRLQQAHAGTDSCRYRHMSAQAILGPANTGTEVLGPALDYSRLLPAPIGPSPVSG